MTDQKNLLLAIVLSIAIILGFQTVFAPPTPTEPPEAARDTGTAPTPPTVGDTPGAPRETPPTVTDPGAPLDREKALLATERVAIETPRLTGSINLTGGLVDDIILRQHRRTVDRDSGPVQLLNPRRARDAYFATVGWARHGEAGGAMPDETTVWETDGRRLTPTTPVTLTWTNDAGVTFQRRFEIDENYMVTITQSVTNNGSNPIQVAPFAYVDRYGQPETLGFFILHEGPIAVFRDARRDRGVQEEKSYSNIRDGAVEADTVGGWLGFTSQYWLVALVPSPDREVKAAFRHYRTGDVFRAEYVGEPRIVAPGASESTTDRVFAGAKNYRVLRDYQDNLNIPRFEWAIDFGWFWFFTKPFLIALQWLFGLVGNFGVAILILTVFIKILFFPLANKSYKSMSRMKKLQPEMLKIRERYKDDRQRMNQEMMGLYKREKVNPAAGCLPILVQIPVFFALYKVLFIDLSMRHAPFFGWIQDLSAKDPTSILNLFGLLPWGTPETGILTFISIGIWPILMGLTMWFQQKLNPAPADPIQAKIFMFLPFIFTFMLAQFPAGLVIYWAWNNLLSIGQQWLIMKKEGVFATAGTGPTNVADLKGGKGKATGGNGKPAADGGEATEAAEAETDGAGEAGEAPETDEKPAPKPARSSGKAAGKGGAKSTRSAKSAGSRGKGGGTRKPRGSGSGSGKGKGGGGG